MPDELKYRCFGSSDRGRQRPENEDNFIADRKYGLFAVADGLGGLPKGALASSLTCEELHRRVRRKMPRKAESWHALAEHINLRVVEAGRPISPEYGIGSTLTAILLQGNEAQGIHVGDSCLYRLRQGKLECLTEEHTMLQDLKQQFPDADYGDIPEHFAHTLTQCIGQQRQLECQHLQFKVRPGDRFLLCTDGVTKVIEDESIMMALAECHEPEDTVCELIFAANAEGGPDNITAVAIYIDETGKARDKHKISRKKK